MRQVKKARKRHKIAVMEYQRITLRIPADLHQELMDVAEEKSMSMNAVVIARLRLAGGLPIADEQADIETLVKKSIQKEAASMNKQLDEQSKRLDEKLKAMEELHKEMLEIQAGLDKRRQ